MAAASIDLSKWHLRIDRGRQWWEQTDEPQTVIDRYLLDRSLPTDFPLLANPSQNPLVAARNGMKFYAAVQTADGHWAHDYGGPHFLLPGLIFALFITNTELPTGFGEQIIRYLKGQQRADGGWGLHIESPSSTVFGTALTYVSLRLLGVARDADEGMIRARKFLTEQNDGAKGIPSWGKFWLATLNLYDWSGLNPIPPELWLLPYSFPAHPARFWCHSRMVYLPMSYIYGRRLSHPVTPLITSLREELYREPYETIDWPPLRNFTSAMDLYRPHPPFLKTVNKLMTEIESTMSVAFRDQALRFVLDHIRVEDTSTNYVDIGPVSKSINLLVNWYAYGADSEQFKQHLARVPDYLWLASDGMKMQGYNGSQLWDTAFSLQAVVATGLATEFLPCLQLGISYLECSQVLEDVPDRETYFRHKSKGAWPFSTRDHGWPISDCTAEGLKCVLQLGEIPELTELVGRQIPVERVFDAVDVMLSLQNEDGGWPTYENKRANDFVENLNPSEVFANIMVDYSHVECTSACIQALVHFQAKYPDHRASEISRALADGVKFIKQIQRADGSWYGGWGVCFTYAIWFAISGLVASGEPLSSPHITKAVSFLLSKQQADGGWGENFGSCETMEYCQNAKTQVVNTAWAVISLITAGYRDDPTVLQRAATMLMSRQQPNGNWLQEDASGVFSANCAISYSGYKNIFPIWALGLYSKHCQSPPSLTSRL